MTANMRAVYIGLGGYKLITNLWKGSREKASTGWR
jgi:hypothetical protein